MKQKLGGNKSDSGNPSRMTRSGEGSPVVVPKQNKYLNKHVSLFKHLLEKPIVENPEEKERRI